MSSIEVNPLSGHLGAEVHGADLANLEAAEFEAIHAAFLEHHVLAFRDQKLTPEQQVAFGRRFGDLHVHPIVPHLEGHPELLPLVNLGKKRAITETWHSDVSFERTPPMASGLYAKTLPPVGGDTLFANQHLAYERLSDGMKSLLSGLRAIHTGAGLGAVTGKGEAWRKHSQAHPVVRTHAETGRKALYVNPAFTVAFEHMTVAESQPLLRFLYEAGHTPDLCYRHRWLPGDLVLWDNRSVQHYAVHDYADAPRTLHRVTVIGDEPH
jgi:taurine dioxygenase